MNRLISPSSDAVSQAVDKYSDMIYRICLMYLKNKADVEDVFQEVFLKFMLQKEPFESEEHEKAWLCRVAFNKCKDLCKSFWRSRVSSIEEMEIPDETPDERELLRTVSALPDKYKQVIYLYYYEGYAVPQISSLIKKNENTVYTLLRRAKTLLKDRLEEESE
ncbi:MAG: sigma-70 family RNA polymerase sigma factor [Clostridia bacterium]|nr:sigma-70 family RNA polymerase sigma factor [Clostridia bacterium]